MQCLFFFLFFLASHVKECSWCLTRESVIWDFPSFTYRVHAPPAFLHSRFAGVEPVQNVTVSVRGSCIRTAEHFIWLSSRRAATRRSWSASLASPFLILSALQQVFVANTAHLHCRRKLHSFYLNKLLSTPHWDSTRVRRLKKPVVCRLRVKSPGKYLVCAHGCHFMNVFRNTYFEIQLKRLYKLNGILKKKKKCL